MTNDKKRKKHTCNFSKGKYHCPCCDYGYDVKSNSKYCSCCSVIIEQEKEASRKEGIKLVFDELDKFSATKGSGVPDGWLDMTAEERKTLKWSLLLGDSK